MFRALLVNHQGVHRRIEQPAFRIFSAMNTFKPTGCTNYCAQIHLPEITRWQIFDSSATNWGGGVGGMTGGWQKS